jgi:hypothetical protein
MSKGNIQSAAFRNGRQKVTNHSGINGTSPVPVSKPGTPERPLSVPLSVEEEAARYRALYSWAGIPLSERPKWAVSQPPR